MDIVTFIAVLGLIAICLILISYRKSPKRAKHLSEIGRKYNLEYKSKGVTEAGLLNDKRTYNHLKGNYQGREINIFDTTTKAYKNGLEKILLTLDFAGGYYSDFTSINGDYYALLTPQEIEHFIVSGEITKPKKDINIL